MTVFCRAPAKVLFGGLSWRKTIAKSITLTVNGIAHTLEIGRRQTLLDVIRDHLHLTGAKYGCGTGDCGTCMVLVDGEPTTSCNYLARRADGKQITTIEGLTDGERLESAATGFRRCRGRAVRFLHPGHDCHGHGVIAAEPQPVPRRDRTGTRWQPLPLYRLREDYRRDRVGGTAHARGGGGEAWLSAIGK